MSNSLISICIPAYNAVNFLEETLESIRCQTYQNWELILVEDGSDDGTKVLVETFRKSVKQQVTYFRNEVNIGLPATRNVAVSMAKGVWYAFVDSDDVWHANHLNSLIRAAQDNLESEFLFSSIIQFTNDINQPIIESNNIVNVKLLETLSISLYKGEFYIVPSSIMVSANLYSTVKGFDESYRFAEDVKFNFTCLQKGFKFAYSGESTCYYRRHSAGISKNLVQMLYYHAMVYEETIDWNWKEIPKKLRCKKTAMFWLDTARMIRESDEELSKISIKKALKYEFNLKTLFYLFRIYILPKIELKKIV